MVTKIFSLFFSFIICVNLHKKMRPAKRSLSVINDDVKFSVFFRKSNSPPYTFFLQVANADHAGVRNALGREDFSTSDIPAVTPENFFEILPR